jgi:hypothetical protein
MYSLRIRQVKIKRQAQGVMSFFAFLGGHPSRPSFYIIHTSRRLCCTRDNNCVPRPPHAPLLSSSSCSSYAFPFWKNPLLQQLRFSGHGPCIYIYIYIVVMVHTHTYMERIHSSNCCDLVVTVPVCGNASSTAERQGVKVFVSIYTGHLPDNILVSVWILSLYPPLSLLSCPPAPPPHASLSPAPLFYLPLSLSGAFCFFTVFSPAEQVYAAQSPASAPQASVCDLLY